MLLPNLEEAVVLTGAREPEAAAWALARGGRDVVITLGADGALWSDGEQVVRAAAAEAPAPVDSTGAGDAFTAGWLAARLGGAEPAEALAAANALAASTLRAGGRALGAGAGRAEDVDAVARGDGRERGGVDLVERRDLGDEALEARRGARDEHARAVRRRPRRRAGRRAARGRTRRRAA